MTQVGESYPVVRSRVSSSRVAGRALKRFKGKNVPPGLFFHAPMAGTRKYRRQPRSRRSKYPRRGSRAITRRPARGSYVPQEVKRRYAETNHVPLAPGLPTVAPWPLVNPIDPLNPLKPSAHATYVPITYQLWQRGLSDAQFTGSRVRLKNISVMMQFTPTKNVIDGDNVPYRFRITHGWCKSNARIAMQSTAAVSETPFPNGMGAIEVRPDTANPVTNAGTGPANHVAVRLAIADTVGINGGYQTEATFPKSQFRVIRDQIVVASPLTESAGALLGTMDRQFRPIVRKFNWTCNKSLRLLPVTSAADVASHTSANSWFTPCNTPGDWTPFVSIACLNILDYSKAAALPSFKFTENTFFNDM